MAAPQIERLRSIKTLPQLLAYLRDELDWPIDSEDTESLTFDYEPSELGLDEKNAVRVKEIKQLRPLSGNQPWGIFFVNFEKKRLPVMVMRRILRALVFKKRATKSERQAWQPSDLLFISAYGEEEDRAITFAHFVEDEELGGLAELRVLGWDDDDTPLKYDYVAHTLQEKLRWRAEFERSQDEWRKSWRDAFELRHREVITTSKQLASKLAQLAKKIRARVRSVLRYEDGFGQIRKLQAAFRKALIHDLSDDDFADMYAQTITYGLFSAAVSRPAGIHGENIVDMVPVTNPFLRDMLKTFLNLSGRKGKIDFDELGIQEVVALLNSPSTHLDAVLRDFGNRTQREDPVIHFYEDFLREYDARKKIQRGVFYTPQPVVSYIVRSIHELLQTEFGLEDGLADTTTWGMMVKKHAELKIPEGVKPEQPFVQILDPATGTATFLVEVIDVIYRLLKGKWDKGGLKAMPALPATSFPRLASAFAEYWNQYVALALLPRLHGYELMMAPYAIAHMKIGLKLFETGYRFGSGERARIYLTNALEPPSDLAEQPEFEAWAPALAHEAKAVNAIKRRQRFTVVMGNPPYSGLSANMSEQASRLIEPYKHVAGVHFGERKHWLHDDYVKFFRLSESRVNDTGVGVLGLITNHAFYDNPTFRGMRWNLLQAFDCIRLLDLHGNMMKRERAPDGEEDKNVFDIQQGVAISIFSKLPKRTKAVVTHGDLWGSRESKYSRLSRARLNELSLHALTPSPQFYFFVPRVEDNATEYECSLRLNEIFAVFSGGFITARDHFVIDFDRAALLSRIEAFANASISDTRIREEYFAGCGSDKYPDGDTRGWKVPVARRQVRKDVNWRQHVNPCLYRPFDQRWIYWTEGMVDWPRPEVNGHLLNEGNLALVFMRQVASGDGYSHFIVSRLPVDNRACYSNKGIMTLAPLYLHESAARKHGELSFDQAGLRANFTPAFTVELSSKLASDASKLSPEDIFHYAYAVFHSPGYRSRYAQFLKIDFPRLPLTGNLELFRALAWLGSELVVLHLLESPKLDKPRSEFIGGRKPEVEKISWSKNTVWIDKAQTIGFKGVPEAVWNFHIGGYQVCEKWLKDRKGRTLSKEDIAHYHKIVVALAETIRLMKEIDEVIDKHGGWPIK